MMKKIFLMLCAFALLGCANTIPNQVTPVTPFDAVRYSGKWYEIARLNHRFEKGMSHVTAQYSMNADGSLKVVNRGFIEQTKTWKEITGRAVFINAINQGHLKVSFFGSFYGGYIVFYLDKDYQHALVSGPSHSYLWLLSRTPTIRDAVKTELMQKIQQAGFDTTQLIMVSQSHSQ